MTAADLVRYVTDALFLIVFLVALVRAVRDRRRTSIDAALFFGALAWILVQGEVTRIFGIILPSPVSDATNQGATAQAADAKPALQGWESG